MTSDSSTLATVLVVDDNEANRALAQGALEDEGYRVHLASSGLEGIAQFSAVRPDCIVLDIRMPDLDGFEVCARIRALEGGDEVPVVFLTALRDVETFDRAVLAGGDDFLTKPVRPSELALRVRAALEVRRARAERSQLSELLRQQRDDMLRAILQKEQLTAFLVHDLKNPVAGMAMAADIIGSDPKVPDRAREAAARIKAHAENLQRLIMNLLDLSKGDAGRLTAVRTRLELHSLVRDVVRGFEGRAAVRRVGIVTDVGAPTLSADETLVRRVLENLLENAIRHAPEASTVRIDAARIGSEVEILVSDTGEGVPAHLRDRIFDRFFRAEPEAQKDRSGRGLGLAFCKVAVEAHGGTIGVRDGVPGAVFWVRIPDA